MIVHSFSPERRWYEAFQRFLGLFGLAGDAGAPAVTVVPGGRRLLLGWACGEARFREM